jgi:hypothetical protein
MRHAGLVPLLILRWSFFSCVDVTAATLRCGSDYFLRRILSDDNFFLASIRSLGHHVFVVVHMRFSGIAINFDGSMHTATLSNDYIAICIFNGLRLQFDIAWLI